MTSTDSNKREVIKLRAAQTVGLNLVSACFFFMVLQHGCGAVLVT